ncbi:MAG: M13 family peptidase [Gammaproteobacteria bacterium]|nr:M13 family peptidase [Gammaproteobacteria bacterium]
MPAVRYPIHVLAATLLAACATPPAPAPVSGLDLAGFDPAVRPQDDLFRHTGGRWLAATRIPADLANYGAFTRLDEDARANVRALIEETARSSPPAGSDAARVADFYNSYMDTATLEARGLAPLAAELARIDAIASRADLAAYIGYNQTIGIGAPLLWYVQQDARDATRYLTWLDQSGLTLPDRDYYLRTEPRYLEYRARLADYIAALLGAAGASEPAAAESAARIVALETELARASWTKVQNRDPVATYNKVRLAAAGSLAPGFDWLRFFAGAGAPVEVFLVSQPSYVTALGGLLAARPLADWKDYFRFRLLDTYAPSLAARFDALHFGFHQRTLNGVEEQPPRWKRAVTATDGALGEITGRLYVQRHFSPAARARARALVDNLLAAYRQSIDQLDWMGPQTRAQAQQKLARISVKIGYPDQWRDYSALQVHADDLVGNLLRSARFEQQRQVRRLGGPVDRSEWLMTPQTVNAYYNPLMNEIVFPAAILQPPFFNAAADPAVNYGGIGAVIGHEISHGFDDQGRQFDGDGNLRDWWTAADGERFKARTAALVQQFNQYHVLDDQPVNGELTLGENIADLSGLAIACQAYRIALQGRPAPRIDGYSGAQRLFLGWGQIWRRKYRDDNLRMRLAVDPHSPSEFRANGPVSNIDAYYAAFDVRPGDREYRAPAERVRIW